MKNQVPELSEDLILDILKSMDENKQLKKTSEVGLRESGVRNIGMNAVERISSEIVAHFAEIADRPGVNRDACIARYSIEHTALSLIKEMLPDIYYRAIAIKQRAESIADDYACKWETIGREITNSMEDIISSEMKACLDQITETLPEIKKANTAVEKTKATVDGFISKASEKAKVNGMLIDLNREAIESLRSLNSVMEAVSKDICNEAERIASVKSDPNLTRRLVEACESISNDAIYKAISKVEAFKTTVDSLDPMVGYNFILNHEDSCKRGEEASKTYDDLKEPIAVVEHFINTTKSADDEMSMLLRKMKNVLLNAQLAAGELSEM
ncbi:hypothetical protein F3I62_18950 [Pseudomonas sp. R-28-1W-6]|uniref:hypothetical protein n=1 Tax=Pseudomonas sp. R-28-1W-6 TaxID=2650101 RepID=UPI00136642DA|nr:hypothetical protein [Pseudomonas sp. R-28-1W-6]MWV14184.1 hypothetical protein [Pseudomonas sp. R-28-1W-6]